MFSLSSLIKRSLLAFVIFSFSFQKIEGQAASYQDSMATYQQHYVDAHEVVAKDDRGYIHFYPVSESYRVQAVFKRINDKKGFEMNTSSGMFKHYFVYGIVTFALHDSLLHLYIYQSESLMMQKKYEDYLFIPFGDATSGFESYGGGRYIDMLISDIKKSNVIIDFNKAYNPYCAYTTGYNCPLPPVDNILQVAVKAGEKNYGKPIH